MLSVVPFSRLCLSSVPFDGCDFGIHGYCKTLIICDSKFSQFSESNMLAHFNFGVHDIPWLQKVKKGGGGIHKALFWTPT